MILGGSQHDFGKALRLNTVADCQAAFSYSRMMSCSVIVSEHMLESNGKVWR